MSDPEICTGEALLEKKDRTTTVVFYIIIIFFAALLSISLFFTHNIVDGESMQNTLQNEQFVILQRAGYSLKRGNIVTVGNIPDHDEPLIKRVVALGGDKVLFMRSGDGRYVDLYLCKSGECVFSPVEEPYIKERMSAGGYYETVRMINYVADISSIDIYSDSESDAELRNYLLSNALTVPKGEFFYLGDNRNNSSDSRVYGTSRCSDILGKVIKIIEQGSKADKILSFLYK